VFTKTVYQTNVTQMHRDVSRGGVASKPVNCGLNTRAEVRRV